MVALVDPEGMDAGFCGSKGRALVHRFMSLLIPNVEVDGVITFFENNRVIDVQADFINRLVVVARILFGLDGDELAVDQDGDGLYRILGLADIDLVTLVDPEGVNARFCGGEGRA